MNVKQTPKVYNYGWLRSGGKGSQLRRLMSSMMQISQYALSGGMYVSASSWQDAPQGPPKIILLNNLFMPFKRLSINANRNSYLHHISWNYSAILSAFSVF